MSGPIFVADNALASATSLTLSGAGSGDLEHLRDGVLSTSHRLGPTAGAYVWWYHAGGLAPALLALHGLRGSSTAALVYETATDSAFTAPVEVARVSPSADSDGYRADVWASITGATAHAYHRLRVLSSGGEATGFDIGQLVTADASRVRQLSRMYRWGYTETEAWSHEQHETSAGTVWSYLRNPSPRRSWTLSWGGLTQSQRDELRGVVRASQGGHLPVSFVPDPDGAGAFYVRAQASVGGPVAFTGNYTIPSLVLTEEAREVA